jgi:hypothetical protein
MKRRRGTRVRRDGVPTIRQRINITIYDERASPCSALGIRTVQNTTLSDARRKCPAGRAPDPNTARWTARRKTAILQSAQPLLTLLQLEPGTGSPGYAAPQPATKKHASNFLAMLKLAAAQPGCAIMSCGPVGSAARRARRNGPCRYASSGTRPLLVPGESAG